MQHFKEVLIFAIQSQYWWQQGPLNVKSTELKNQFVQPNKQTSRQSGCHETFDNYNSIKRSVIFTGEVFDTLI